MNALKKNISKLAAAAVVAGVCAVAAPANAASALSVNASNLSTHVVQVHSKKMVRWGHGHHRAISKKRLKNRLRAWGFKSFKKVERRGDVYIVKASRRGQQRARLVVDAYSGQILKYRYLGY
ncbi:hypothetical protein PsAD2_01250 [Pseudovibrio axinellae]|uniref:PepSY domain-containing protein n=1 Tax=Pseudovibrio axinellae TaxID=989403 RepID=A0A166A9S2_9HYPH|nr:hypothetical protein [Pseudovibrio axinellae]KZL20762.1 hypothetical protein PsAD2_01250 [Pseudovibrio axinellae]SER23404.1 hypothetical protein SAMN05421798_107127 [Pseudovibrio axinellae]